MRLLERVRAQRPEAGGASDPTTRLAVHAEVKTIIEYML
jgi:hypothetical protein